MLGNSKREILPHKIKQIQVITRQVA